MPLKNKERNSQHGEDTSQVLLGESNDETTFLQKPLQNIKSSAELSDNWIVNIVIVLSHFLYSFGGLIFGVACIVGGVLLFINGISGSTNWTTKLLGVESEITDAAPGAILFVLGLLVAYATRFVIKNPRKTG